MNIIRRQNYLIPQAMILLVSVFISLLLSSCSKAKLTTQQNFPFEVIVMPVPKEVAEGGRVELRMRIQPTGSFKDAAYFIRYFQYDGKGTLQYHNDPPYLPNDIYEITDKEFRLYYTSLSAVTQSIDLWIFDNFGNEQRLTFEFKNSE